MANRGAEGGAFESRRLPGGAGRGAVSTDRIGSLSRPGISLSGALREPRRVAADGGGGNSPASRGVRAWLVPPAPIQFEVTAKLYTKFSFAFPSEQIADGAIRTLDEFRDEAGGAAQRLRTAMVAAEVQGTQQGLKRLEQAEADLEADSPLH